uniref:Uncharacterized protein AlNc14C65G4616 n=1 Tax=Albugo laibachii Nc14 TaxID=890382 RepID=F0WD96_9STRA|nr:conserved hypothetical protein [Albugo laibachii Nc14]|eukprot:CCA19168.1 conserved hypothetical protein [Albugo laibachii Nc14]
MLQTSSSLITRNYGALQRMEKIQQVHGTNQMCKVLCREDGSAKSDPDALSTPTQSLKDSSQTITRHTNEPNENKAFKTCIKTEIPNRLRRVWYEEISQSFQDFQQRCYVELRGLCCIHAVLRHNLPSLLTDIGIARCHPCERRGVSKGAKTCCNAPGCPHYQQNLCRECFDSIHPIEDPQLRTHPQILSIICPLCRLAKITCWCQNCDLSFCTDCFDAVHIVRRVAGHVRVNLESGVSADLFTKADWAHYFRNVMVKLIEQVQTPTNRYHLIKDDSGRDVVCLSDSDQDETYEEKHAKETVKGKENAPIHSKNDEKASAAMETHQTCSNAIGNLNSHPLERVEPVVSVQEDHDTKKTSFFSSMVQVTEAKEPTPFHSINTSNPQNVTPIQSNPENYPKRPPIQVNPRVSSMSVAQPSVNNVGTISRISAVPSQYFDQDRAIIRDTVVSQPGVWVNNGTPRYTEPNYNMQISTGIGSPGINTFPSNSTPSIVSLNNVAAAFAPGAKCQSSPTSPNTSIDLLYENYNRTNMAVSQMEQAIMLSNQRIMKLSRCNISHAQQIMKQLQQTQRKLRVLVMSRDICVVNIILQSPRLMQNIHQLHLQTLSDVAQVTNSCHRKCAHLAEQIQRGELHLMGLNQQMEELVNHDFSLPDYHKKVLELHQKIEEVQNSLATWKAEREHELVRIVHYSRQIRDLLKQQFQRQHNGTSETVISTFPTMGIDGLN